MKRLKNKASKILVRHNRIRAKISGTSSVPRLSVYKSNTNVYGQIIDDTKSITLVSYSQIKAR
jgi:large subunit ribosomal protein L18